MYNSKLTDFLSKKEMLNKEKQALQNRINEIESQDHEINFLIEEMFSNQLTFDLDCVSVMLEKGIKFSANHLNILRKNHNLTIENNVLVKHIGEEAQFVICVSSKNEKRNGLDNFLKMSKSFKEHEIEISGKKLKGKFLQVYFNRSSILSLKETFICLDKNEAVIFKVEDDEIVFLTPVFNKNDIKKELDKMCD